DHPTNRDRMTTHLLELDPATGQITELDPATGQIHPHELARRRARRFMEGAEIMAPIADIPDGELIRTLVSLGQPEWSARQLMGNPQLRLAALRLWADVGAAGRGDGAAKERVDYVRAAYARMRKEELISDDPSRGHGDAFDPKE